MARDEVLRKGEADVNPLLEARKQANMALLGKALTVGELVRLLASFEPTLPVLLVGPEGGLTNLVVAEQVDVQLAVNTLEGFGPHDLALDAAEADMQAVLLTTARTPA